MKKLLGTSKFPARSTYFDRYRRAHRLFKEAIKLQGEKAIKEGVADAKDVAVGKSLIAARGPLWHKSDRKKNRVARGLRGTARRAGWLAVVARLHDPPFKGDVQRRATLGMIPQLLGAVTGPGPPQPPRQCGRRHERGSDRVRPGVYAGTCRGRNGDQPGPFDGPCLLVALT